MEDPATREPPSGAGALGEGRAAPPGGPRRMHRPVAGLAPARVAFSRTDFHLKSLPLGAPALHNACSSFSVSLSLSLSPSRPPPLSETNENWEETDLRSCLLGRASCPGPAPQRRGFSARVGGGALDSDPLPGCCASSASSLTPLHFSVSKPRVASYLTELLRGLGLPVFRSSPLSPHWASPC